MRTLILVAALLIVGPQSKNTWAQSRQIAHLNHISATVDAQTAEAIRTSEFLHRFANFEVRSVSASQGTWTGRYVSGRQTYVEFVAPDDSLIDGKPTPVGAWGLALSGDRPGHVHALKTRLEASGYKASIDAMTRTFGARVVPWFKSLSAISKYGDSAGERDIVSVWAMEYASSYFDQPEAQKEPAEGPLDRISRERYQSDLYADRMMRDITAVQFAVTPRDFARIEPLLKAAGFRIRRSKSRIEADGEQADVRFTMSPERSGLREISFLLNRPVPYHTEVIGNSTLIVGPGATAVWTFR